jgi:regulator of protease activity HflC (stomatin/prohibitin superfamily)
MVIAQMLGFLAVLFWIGLVGYVAMVLTRRSRREDVKFSISLIVALIVLGTLASSASAGLVVIDAGEVGVIFNSFTGTRPDSLDPGIHFVTPYIETVYRYSTLEQVYTMSKIASEGQVQGDDSLWSPTLEGLQVGIDSSTRYKINPAKASFLHNNLRDYNNIVVRPAIRSIVRLHVSRNTVTDVYGPKRAEIQASIETDIRARFEPEGLILLSFDIRNVNFTDEYAKSIEQKQIAQQQAEQMQFVLDKETKEAQRKRVEASGIKDSAVIKAEGDAQALKLISEALSTNPNLIQYRYIEKLAPNIQVMLVPSNSPFLLDAKSLGVTVPAPVVSSAPIPAVPAPTPVPTPSGQ